MTGETTYRILMLLNIALCLPVGVYHRISSAASREELARREEGLIPMIALRLFGLLGWIGTIAYLLNPEWMAWSSVSLPAWLRWGGAVIGLVVVPPLLFWTFHNLGKNLTDTVVTRREHTLVTSGPYRWVRHPFYVVVFLWITGLSLLTANWFLALVGLLVVAMQVNRTRIEEEKLVERFGDEYRAYRQRTGKFFPRIVRW